MSKRRLLLLALGIAAGLYVTSYGWLAWGGGYVWVRSGHFRPVAHLASTDLFVWQPKKGTFYGFKTVGGEDKYQADWLGRLFSPLILLQQATISPSIRTVLADGTVPTPKPRIPERRQLHPEVRKQVPAMEETFGMSWEQFREKILQDSL